MIQILDLESDDLLGYRVDGKIQEADVQRAVAAAEAKLAARAKLRVYAEVHSLGGLTWGAIVADVEATLKRLDWFTRFERVAVVSDQGLVRAVARVEELLFRGIRIHTFHLAEKERALLWLTA